MRKGELSINGEVLDHAARWYAYRFTIPAYLEPNEGRKLNEMQKQLKEQLIDLHNPKRPPSKQQVVFMDEFRKRLSARLYEVVKNPQIIVRINAAMLLASVAKTGYEETTDILVELIQDPAENEGVKFWAFRGLKDFFHLGAGDNLDPFRNKEREARCVQALLDYLGRKPSVGAAASAEELEAVAYVRREATAALGETRAPAESRLQNKQRVIERQTALALLHILNKEGVTPPPDFSEQVAAAIGICQLRYRMCDEYQVDYAAHQVGRFIVDFIQHRNNEQAKKRYAWKITAVHLSEALDTLKADAVGPPASAHAAYVRKIADQGMRLLREVIDAKSDAVPNDFATWLEQNPPQSTSAYKGVATAVVGAGTKTGAE
jgi:hypothetical protein